MENLPLKDTKKHTHTQAMVSILITVVEGVKIEKTNFFLLFQVPTNRSNRDFFDMH